MKISSLVCLVTRIWYKCIEMFFYGCSGRLHTFLLPSKLAAYLHCKQDFHIAVTGIAIQTHIVKKKHTLATSVKQHVTLKYHMKTHTGVNPNTCHNRGEGFSQKIYFKTQMRTSTGPEPYKC